VRSVSGPRRAGFSTRRPNAGHPRRFDAGSGSIGQPAVRPQERMVSMAILSGIVPPAFHERVMPIAILIR
jgi:hypothetical protein